MEPIDLDRILKLVAAQDELMGRADRYKISGSYQRIFMCHPLMIIHAPKSHLKARSVALKATPEKKRAPEARYRSIYPRGVSERMSRKTFR